MEDFICYISSTKQSERLHIMFKTLSKVECPLCGKNGEFVKLNTSDHHKNFYMCRNEDCLASNGLDYFLFYKYLASENGLDLIESSDVTEFVIREAINTIHTRNKIKDRWLSQISLESKHESISPEAANILHETRKVLDNSAKTLANQEMSNTKREYYRNFFHLITINPEAVLSETGEYLERPNDGWIESNPNSFIGIGYHGNEMGSFSDNWYSAKAGLGHIPSGGYG